jgi:hypothetical protein
MRLALIAALLAALAAPAPLHAQPPGAQVATALDAQGRRDPWLWPFLSRSEWNTPLGSGARFAPADDPTTVDILAGGTAIHAGEWSHPLYLAHPDDPFVTVFDQENERSFRVRVPPGAKPDPMSDGHMYVVDPAKRSVLEMIGVKRAANGDITSVRAFQVSLYGTGMHMTDGKYPGIRAMDASGMGGLIRAWELQAHRIPHAVTFLLPPWRLKHGPVWPSAREDYWGFRDYKGNVPIGALIAIPPAVDVTKLGLTPSGLALARALQDYGAYCDDSSGSQGIIISAEGATEGMAELRDMRADFPKIRAYLRVVTNNTAATPGGGTPRQPPAPPLQAP